LEEVLKMRTGLSRKYLCLVVVLLFVIPSVTALSLDNNEKQNNKDHLIQIDNKNKIADQEIDIEQGQVVDTLELLKKNARISENTVNRFDLDPSLTKKLSDQFSDLLIRENPSLNYKKPQEINSDPIKRILFPDTKTKSTTQADQPIPGTRQARADEDLEIWNMRWDVKNSGWCESTDPDAVDNPDDPANWYNDNQAAVGSFIVGETTKITITVRNNAPSAVSNVRVNLSIWDYIHDNQPMLPSPTTKTISSIGAGQTGSAVFDFKPKYATTYARIYAYVDWPTDPDTTNNGLIMNNVNVVKWWDDLESGVSSWSHTARSDIVTGSTDDWDLSTSAFAQTDPTHTTTHSWYEGSADGFGNGIYPGDSYRNDNALSLVSPTINLGNDIDERNWNLYMGRITSGQFAGWDVYMFYVNSYNYIITGESEEETDPGTGAVDYDNSDVLWCGEVSDNGGSSYGQIMNIAFTGRLGDVGQTEWYNYYYIMFDIGSQDLLYFQGIPFNWNVTNWNNVKFRQTFHSDDDNVQNIGYYIDDYLVSANENYTIPDRVGFSEVEYPKSSIGGQDVSILYKDTLAKIKFTVNNYGGYQQALTVKMSVKDKETGQEVYSGQKSVGNLDTDGEKEDSISWTPIKEGDFYVTLEVGDTSKDWTPADNIEHMYIHVTNHINDEVDVLVVDDDDSAGQMGIFVKNTEDKMLKALWEGNEIDYRVYTVEYNETGPTVDIMDDYELVIWMTGLDNEIWAHGGRSNYNKNNPAWDITLKNDDLSELETFLNLNDEKKLWLISPGFPYDKYGIDYKTTPKADFARQFLHMYNCQPNLTQHNDNGDIIAQGTPNPLEGVPDSVMDSVEYTTYDMPDILSRFDDIGGVAEQDPTDEDTMPLFFQDDSRLQHNSIMYKGEDYMTCYFGFNFYLITDEADRQDCVYRVLTGFGMTGGVLIELLKSSAKLQTVYPGKDASYQFRVSNLGKKEDTMELSVKVTYSKDYPISYKDWDPRFEENKFVKKSGGKYKVTLAGLADTNQVELIVTAPDTDDYSTYPAANEKVKFTITAKSTNTQLENETYVRSKIPVLGNITMTAIKTDAKIKIDEEADYPLELFNETNAEDNVDVELSFSGDAADLAKFLVKNQPTNNKKLTAELEPNEENEDYELRITPEEHTLAGYHNVTVSLKDVGGLETYDEVELTTEVEQFYQVECYTSGDKPYPEVGDTSFTIDPNDYADQGDYINMTFYIYARNMGNWYDRISLSYDDTNILDWGTIPRIYRQSGSGDENITSVRVKYYDESKNPKYGEELVYFDISIPIEVEVGNYSVDFIISSSNPLEEESSGEEKDNNIVTFYFDIIQPNLVFTKLDKNANPNFEFYDEENILIEESFFEFEGTEIEDYYIERSYKDFADLSIDIKVTILNDGLNDVELSKTDLKLNISYYDEDGFTVYEEELYPITPNTLEIAVEQTGEFTFRWFPLTPTGKEPFEYALKLTLDVDDNIFEIDEGDNSEEFTIWIEHTPKPSKGSGGGGMPGFESVLMIAAILVVLLGIMYSNRRRKH
jgi:hypothetical protein